MNPKAFNAGLIDFIDASPSPWHAAQQMRLRLEEAGFVECDGEAAPGSRVFRQRGGSIVAAITPGELDSGWRIVGAHTDSPNLRFKPNALYLAEGCLMASIETYGGVLMNPWFDRELGLAGRAVVRDADGLRQTRLVDSGSAVALVPSLAIHLDREANKARSINAEKDLNLVLGRADAVPSMTELLADWGLHAGDEVLAYDLCAYPMQPSDMVGLEGDWVVAPRLDNLLSCYAGLAALLQAQPERHGAVLICNDHEEVGSTSAVGADGPMLERALNDWYPEAGALDQSLMFSADNAHGVHPNYADKHAATQRPLLNEGPVLKINANQRYASEPEMIALALDLAEQNDIPVQQFANRADLGCGSTIGPITASRLGVPTLDLGAPTWGMHSTRETAGQADGAYLARLLHAFMQAG
ncbi:MAG: M18 family aminopeptidase [Litorivicinus sp.]